MFDKNGYYTTDKIKSYDARFYIVASERGLGKTYGEKKALFRNWTRRRRRFACIYRTGADLVASLQTWLDPLTSPAPLDKTPPIDPNRFKWQCVARTGAAYNLLYEEDGAWEPIGFFRNLQSVNMVKYETFPLDIEWVWVDEFAPMAYKKLAGVDNEPEALLVCIDTMDHDSGHPKNTIKDENGNYYPAIKCILFCNPRNRVSPFYDFFNIPAFRYGVFKTRREVVVEQIEPLPSKDPERLGENARKCVAFLNKTSYIAKITAGSTPAVSIRLVDHYYVAYDTPDGKRVIKRATKHAEGCYLYLGTLDYLGGEEKCLTFRTSQGTYLDWLKQRFNGGLDYYVSVETKYSYIQDILNL